MSLVTKWFLGQMGRLRAAALEGEGAGELIALPAPARRGGMPLMEALARRQSGREFAPTPIDRQHLSDLLWAADGINRPQLHEHTAPSAMNAQEIDVYVALADGLYRYAPEPHVLQLVAHTDARRVTGLQEFVDMAPLDLVYVADFRRMFTMPPARHEPYACVCAGAIAQNVYLYCASEGLSTVVRGLFDADALGVALGLRPHQRVILAQTVGWPASPVGPASTHRA